MGEGVKRKQSTPSGGYICKVCNLPGHWIQQCPQKKRPRKNPNHIPVPGVDPSQNDIDLARSYQKISPPNCFCAQKARLKKVKQSKVNPDQSRAVGKYFFFCAKHKDQSPCRFARLADEVMKEMKRKTKKQTSKGDEKKGKDTTQAEQSVEPVKNTEEETNDEEVVKKSDGDASDSSSDTSDSSSDEEDGNDTNSKSSKSEEDSSASGSGSDGSASSDDSNDSEEE